MISRLKWEGKEKKAVDLDSKKRKLEEDIQVAKHKKEAKNAVMVDILSKMMNDKISKERIKGFVRAAEDARQNKECTSLDLEKLQEKQNKLLSKKV